ncbi:hypothetical protein RsoM2USA_439 [Ralstonia phage RsoM2USA]|nr:hypothetical protein RsoM2USA_439 [Ralstonia phage RsoM2USA]
MTTSNIVQPIPSDLAKWLAGFIEITGGRLPTTEEWAKIVEKVGQATLTQLPTPAPKPSVKEDIVKKAAEEMEEAIKKYERDNQTGTNPVPPYRPWIYPSDRTGTPWAYPPNYPPNYPWNEPIVVD